MAEQMKASGVVWIGDIPESWRIGKVRFETTLRGEKGYYSDQDKYIGLENISSYTGEFLPSETEYDPGIYDIYRKGDLLYNKLRPYLAKAMIAKDDGFCTGELEVINGYNGDMRYLFYYLLSDGFLKIVDASTYGTKMPRASWDYIKNLPILLLDYYEQQTIADYLDKRCGEIDSIIADIEKQIDLLKQYKKSLITETVTKGLDKSVPMKDSGVEWIGMIPNSWKMSRIKYLTDEKHPYPIGDGDHGLIKADEYTDDGIPYIRVLNLTWGFGLKMDDIVYIPEKLNQLLKSSILRPNDILIAKTGATIGKTAIIPDSLPISNTTSHVGKITLPNIYEAKYFYYIFTSEIIQKQIQDISAMQSTRPELGIEGLKNLIVIVPSLEEQKAIAHYLDKRCKEFDEILINKQQQLELMQQHKKSLIYEYVTGKKRVKEAM